MKDLKDVRVMIPATCLFYSPTWPVQKTGGSWRMTAGSGKLGQVVIPLAAAICDGISLFEQVNTSPRYLYETFDLANGFVFLHIC